MIQQIDFKELLKRPHFPVMLNEVLFYIHMLNQNKIILDCTFGSGGYSEYILKNTKANVIALDRDSSVSVFADELKKEYTNRFQFYISRFSELDLVLHNQQADAIVLDLGLSTMQIKDKSRGFSFNLSGELSMGMGLNKSTAFDLLNKGSEELIADVLHHYGEERKAKAIARKVIENRKPDPIETSEQFANIIKMVVKGYKNINPATKSFQAVRIYVNDELQELQTALTKAIDKLSVGGILIVVSFHSLEDRIVKVFFNKLNENYKIITKKPITPTLEETKINRASSSAKMRVLQRIK